MSEKLRREKARLRGRHWENPKWSNLRDRERSLYDLLWSLSIHSKTSPRSCYPTQEWLGDRLRGTRRAKDGSIKPVSTEEVRRCLKALEAAGWIAIGSELAKEGLRAKTYYILRHPDGTEFLRPEAARTPAEHAHQMRRLRRAPAGSRDAQGRAVGGRFLPSIQTIAREHVARLMAEFPEDFEAQFQARFAGAFSAPDAGRIHPSSPGEFSRVERANSPDESGRIRPETPDEFARRERTNSPAQGLVLKASTEGFSPLPPSDGGDTGSPLATRRAAGGDTPPAGAPPALKKRCAVQEPDAGADAIPLAPPSSSVAPRSASTAFGGAENEEEEDAERVETPEPQPARNAVDRSNFEDRPATRPRTRATDSEPSQRLPSPVSPSPSDPNLPWNVARMLEKWEDAGLGLAGALTTDQADRLWRLLDTQGTEKLSLAISNFAEQVRSGKTAPMPLTRFFLSPRQNWTAYAVAKKKNPKDRPWTEIVAEREALRGNPYDTQA